MSTLTLVGHKLLYVQIDCVVIGLNAEDRDTADGMIRGTTGVHGDGTTHGTIADGTEDGMTHGITAAGMEVTGAGTIRGIIHITRITDGMTLIGDIYMVRDTGRAGRDIRRMYGTDRATRPVLTGYSPAALHSEAA